MFEKNVYLCYCRYHFIKTRCKCEKTHPAIRPADPIRFLRFSNRRNTRKQDPFDKSRFGQFFGGKSWGSKSVVGKLTSRSQCEDPTEPHIGVSDVIWFDVQCGLETTSKQQLPFSCNYRGFACSHARVSPRRRNKVGVL